MELVVGASEATMKSLLSKLGGLLAHEYALIRGVRGDIQYINNEMASMQAFLGDLTDGARRHDRRMRDWAKQIRDVTYDIEDCVDDFAHRLAHDPAAGDGPRCCDPVVFSVYEVWTWWPRREIASAVAELKMRAQQIGERRIRYGVENPNAVVEDETGAGPTGFEAAANQKTDPELVGTKKPVGVDKEMIELGKWVTLQQPAAPSPHDPSSDLASQTEAKMQAPSVLSIVGFGGVGKTTIATALYQKYSDQFDRRATVTVSQSSDIDMILRTILSQVMPQSKDGNEQQGGSGGTSEKKRLMAAIGTVLGAIIPKSRKDDELQGGSISQITEGLKEHLEKHSYLILVDDVWSATTWEKIKKSLPKSKKRSRVIITTRFPAVASACRRDDGDHIHKVGVLTLPENLALPAAFYRAAGKEPDMPWAA